MTQEQDKGSAQPVAKPAAPPMQGEMKIIQEAIDRVGIKSLLNHGAGSLVWSEGVEGVTQDDLLAYTREVALHCAVALAAPQPNAAALEAAVRKLHAAKGRYHTQLACCDLYDLLGLPNVRPGQEPESQPNAALAEGWISVDERLPMEPDADVVYEKERCIVTDGKQVGVTDFDRGHGAGKPWAAWSMYGDINGCFITHWMLFPKIPAPPTLNASKED